MAFFGAVLGGMVRLTCPHCHVVQVRGRGPLDVEVRCNACHRAFRRQDGEPCQGKVIRHQR